MTDIASVLSAGAACVAAALSGATFWVTGKREERRWRRDAIVDTTCDFLDASYRRIRSATARAAWAGRNLDSDAARMADAFDAQRSAMTRLRLLAPSPIVEAAEYVIVADTMACDAIFGPDGVRAPGAGLPTHDEWVRLQERRRDARQGLLDAFRYSAGLGPAKHLMTNLAMIESKRSSQT